MRLDPSYFIKQIISDEFEFDDDYNASLDDLLKNKEFLRRFSNEIANHINQFNDVSVLKIIHLLYGVIIIREVYPQGIYDVTLKIMFNNYSINPSIPYKFVDILIAIKRKEKQVFKDLVIKMDESNSKTILISLFALYGFRNKDDFDESDVRVFAEKAINCLKNNQSHYKLGQGINDFLQPLLSKRNTCFDLAKQIKELG